MKKFGLLIGLLITTGTVTFGQGAKNVKLNEVMVNNTTNYVDEYGQHPAWIELANTSFSTYDVRGMYLTSDRSVLDPNMSVPERIKKMSIIPSEEDRTLLTARQHLLLFANSSPNSGALHLSLKLDSTKSNWIALYDGNARDIIDSVTIPPLHANTSFARITDGSDTWRISTVDAVTPGISNKVGASSESKVAKVKREDPSGIGLTVLAMGVVFFCLALLYAFFRVFGIVVTYENKLARAKTWKAISETSYKALVIAKDGYSSKGIDKETYVSLIAMALKEYEEDVHDVESNIITITPKNTTWADKSAQMTEFHE